MNKEYRRVVDLVRNQISYYYIPKGLWKITRIVDGKEVVIYS